MPSSADLKLIEDLTTDQLAQIVFLMNTRNKRDLVRKTLFRWLNVATGEMVDAAISASRNHPQAEVIKRKAAELEMNDAIVKEEVFAYWNRTQEFADVLWLVHREGEHVYVTHTRPPRYTIKLAEGAKGAKTSDGLGIVAAWFIDTFPDEYEANVARDSAFVAYERYLARKEMT